jgi:hypothetical protein
MASRYILHLRQVIPTRPFSLTGTPDPRHVLYTLSRLSPEQVRPSLYFVFVQSRVAGMVRRRMHSARRTAFGGWQQRARASRHLHCVSRHNFSKFLYIVILHSNILGH